MSRSTEPSASGHKPGLLPFMSPFGVESTMQVVHQAMDTPISAEELRERSTASPAPGADRSSNDAQPPWTGAINVPDQSETTMAGGSPTQQSSTESSVSSQQTQPGFPPSSYQPTPSQSQADPQSILPARQGFGQHRPPQHPATPWDYDPFRRFLPLRGMTYYQAFSSYPNPAARVPAMYHGIATQPIPPASAPPTTLPVWTPVSPSPGGFVYEQITESHAIGTVQPSAFPSWQNGHEAPGHAAHVSIFSGGFSSARERSKGPNRLDGRRSSTPGQAGEQRDDYNPFAAGLSRSTSEPSSNGEEVVKKEEEPTEITYTTDGDAKQTKWLRRKCYNCGDTSPPNWRKSMLAKGKILCNRCGIYERTHHRARPPHSKKLRKGSKRPVPTFSPVPQVPNSHGEGSEYSSSNEGSPSRVSSAGAKSITPITGAIPAGGVFDATTASVPLLSSSALPQPPSTAASFPLTSNDNRHSLPPPYGLATPMTSSIGAGRGASSTSALRLSPYGQHRDQGFQYNGAGTSSAAPGFSSTETVYGRHQPSRRAHPQPIIAFSPSGSHSSHSLTPDGVVSLHGGPMRGYWGGFGHHEANVHPALRNPESTSAYDDRSVGSGSTGGSSVIS